MRILIGLSLILLLLSVNTFFSCTGGVNNLSADTTTSLCRNYKDLFKIGTALSTRVLNDSLSVELATGSELVVPPNITGRVIRYGDTVTLPTGAWVIPLVGVTVSKVRA